VRSSSATTETRLEIGERDGSAFGEGEHLSVDHVGPRDREQRRHQLRVAVGDAVERAGVKLHAVTGLVHLRADAVVLVFDDVGRGKTLLDLFELQNRRRKHHPDRQEVRERRLRERPVFRAECRLADVAGQHVGPSDLFPIAPERAGDRLLEQAFPQSDAGLAAHDLHDVARLVGGGSRQRRAQQIAFRGDTARGCDGVERLRDVGKRESLSAGGTVADQVRRDVPEVGVSLVGLGHVAAVLAGSLEQDAGERAPPHR